MTAYVFVHGLPSNAYTWEPFFEHAPSGVRCIAWDAPDCGDAEDAPAATLADYESALVAEVRSAGTDVVLVGHSFGAFLVARLLARLGGSVRRAVFVSGMAALGSEHAASFGPLADRIERGELGLEQIVGLATDLWLPKPHPDPIHVAWVDRLVRHEGKDRLVRALRRLAALGDPSLAAGRFETPASLVHSESDRSVPLAYGHALASLGRDVQVSVLPGDSHFPQWTAAEAVARIVFA